MDRLGHVHRSGRPWASPLHIAPKPTRPITADSLTATQSFTSRIFLAGKGFFSKVDLICGYYQVPQITPFRLFEFLPMPFSLKNIAQTFQQLMDSVLQDLPFLFVYLDDILVVITSKAEHLAHLRTLFERLSHHGLIVNPAMCQFGRTTKDGVVPLPLKVDAVMTFPRPLTVKSLQEFLGMVYCYHRFLPSAAQLTLV